MTTFKWDTRKQKPPPGEAWFGFEDGPWHGQAKTYPAHLVRPGWVRPVNQMIHVLPLWDINARVWLESGPEPEDLADHWNHHYDWQEGRTRDLWRYVWRGPKQQSWGRRHDLEMVEHETRWHAAVIEQMRSQMFPPPKIVWVLPLAVGPSVSVFQGLQVIHAEVPEPYYAVRPDYPTWGEVTGQMEAMIRGLDL